MMSVADIRRRLAAGETYQQLGAELGLSADAFRKRAARLGVTSAGVLGRRRRRPALDLDGARARSRRRAEREATRRATRPLLHCAS